MSSAKKLFVFIALFCALLACPAFARPVSVWTFENLTKNAEALATGEVQEIVTVGPIAAEATHWHAPLLQMRAKIKVLRTIAAPGKASPTPDQTIALDYFAIDWKNGVAMVNGPFFPQLSRGDVFVFPLKQKQDGWELLHEENFNQLTPAPRQSLLPTPATDGIEFLRAELAGVFALGDDAHIKQAAEYLRSLYHDDQNAPAIYELAAGRIGHDENRWLNIAVACYCSLGTPRPPIADLIKTPAGQKGALYFITKALLQIPAAGRDDKLIETAVRNSATNAWGTSTMLADNYARHPATIRLLGEAIRESVPGTLGIAGYIIKDKTHPLLTPALAAAVRLLLKTPQPGTDDAAQRDLSAACRLVDGFGSNKDRAILLNELKKAQKADRKRYSMIWNYSMSNDGQHSLPVLRLVIADDTEYSKGYRYSDIAAFEVQRLAQVDFGLKQSQNGAEREQAIARAKEWLSKHQ